jgi:two-component system, OmpR family, response regulator MprA
MATAQPHPVSALVVDDDLDSRTMLAELIRHDGYTVATASDGKQALEILESTRPELILLDVCMPEMDGPTFRQIMRRNRNWITIPTIVMTGAAEEPMLDLAVEETLRKPVQPKEVLAIVRRHCTRRAPRP